MADWRARIINDLNKIIMLKRFNITAVVTFIIIAAGITGCYENEVSPIPDYMVRLQLNLTAQYPNFINNPNQSLLFEKRILESDRIGYGGILVYCGFDLKYYAFDMACPNEVKTTIRVYPNDEGQAVCEKCGSVFDISYGIGSPVSGPAKHTLKRYKTFYSGNILYVTL